MYVTTRDTMDESVFSLRAAHYLLSRDTKSTIQQLHQENKEQIRSRNIMLAWMLLLVLTGMIGYRSIQLRRKNEKLKFESKTAALQKKALELEMQALRSQMNPHFIFNCLNAIDNLVQKGQGEKATIYLSKFARLIRLVMEISRKNLIPFHQDMEAMRLYLKLEQFRCQNAFDFFIEIDDNLTHGDFEVPPLIIQPFIENAIHHGLLNKPGGDRVLTIQVQLMDNHIEYHIKDNGIGRAKAIELRQLNNPGHQSYGIGITRERLQLHNKETSGEDVYIMDMDSEKNHTGTCVIVRILIDP
jgi:LytS/YehU family sensor histidine kinase